RREHSRYTEFRPPPQNARSHRLRQLCGEDCRLSLVWRCCKQRKAGLELDKKSSFWVLVAYCFVGRRKTGAIRHRVVSIQPLDLQVAQLQALSVRSTRLIFDKALMKYLHRYNNNP